MGSRRPGTVPAFSRREPRSRGRCGTRHANRRERSMKIRVERDGLADAVAWVARSLPSRPSIPVLGGVLIDAGSDADEAGTSSDALTVAGFDYEVSATVDVPATIAAPGRALVSGRLLADITKSLPAQPVE